MYAGCHKLCGMGSGSPGDSARRVGLRERKKAQTRADIRRHGLRLFAARGFAETSVEDIADAANVSVATVFRYFSTKDAIALDLPGDDDLPSAIRRQAAHLTPLEAVSAAIGEAFGHLDFDQLNQYRDRQVAITATPQLALGALAKFMHTRDQIADALSERSTGLDDLTLQLMAGAIVGVLLGAHHRDQALDDDIVARAQQGIRHLARGFNRDAHYTL